MKYNKPKLKFWTLGFIVLMLSLSTRAEIHLSEDGGYSNIVIKISDQLDMNKCSDIIAGLKVRGEKISVSFTQFCQMWWSKIRVLGLNLKCFMACFLLASAKILDKPRIQKDLALEWRSEGFHLQFLETLYSTSSILSQSSLSLSSYKYAL